MYRTYCKKCKAPVSKEAKLNSPTKVCKHCGIEKPKSEYQKAGGGNWLQPYCKPCDSERKKKHTVENIEKVKERQKQYYQENFDVISEKTRKAYIKNREKLIAYQKEYKEKNPDLIAKRRKEYSEKNRDELRRRRKENYHSNRDKILEQERARKAKRTPEQIERDAAVSKAWRDSHKGRVSHKKYKTNNTEKRRESKRVWCNKMSATNVEFRLLKNLRGRTRFALKHAHTKKADRLVNMLGCTIPEFKAHFESLFTEGMTWDAFMAGEIHIDHIKPCKLFSLSDPEQQRACFVYTNLQPLWKMDNLKKGSKCLTP